MSSPVTPLPQVSALRYVTPLREGGSLPGVMEADDDGTYVVKFTGAGQGPRTLVAEVICAHLLRVLELPVPDLVVIDIDPAMAIGEPDEEVQDLLKASPGRNLGMDFLPGALDLDVKAFPIEPGLAGRILWFDALVGNVDRTWRNPNMLSWHRRPYLIDHGATLTFAHHWAGAPAWIPRAYDAREHAVRGCSPDLPAADADLAPRLDAAVVNAAVAQVPDEWLVDADEHGGLAGLRAAYADQILARLAARAQWLPALIASLS
jgi:hypothetical protein